MSNVKRYSVPREETIVIFILLVKMERNYMYTTGFLYLYIFQFLFIPTILRQQTTQNRILITFQQMFDNIEIKKVFYFKRFVISKPLLKSHFCNIY